MASNSNYNDVIFFFPSFLHPSFLPLLHSHGVEKPVVGVVPVDAVIALSGDPLRKKDHFPPKDPLEVSVLLHVFLDHLVDVVRRLAGHQMLWRVESRMIRFT